MNAHKTWIAIVVMFLFAVGAGVVAGKLTARRSALSSPQPAAGGSPLSDELQLTPEQREQIRPIWESVRTTARGCAVKANDIQQDHQRQLIAMLTDAQKGSYEKLTQQTHDRILEVDGQREQIFREAVAKTNQFLREDQREAYKQIIRNRIGGLAADHMGLQ